jgi:hypothetical protein
MDKTDINVGFFAAPLARFDLPAAMVLAREFHDRDKDRVFCLMASQLASVNPAESERLWNEIRGSLYREMLEVCWRLASSAPECARRIADKAADQGDPAYYVVLAHGLALRDKAAARLALIQGLDRVDRLMDDPQSDFHIRRFLSLTLEVIDRIDADLIPDVLWRYVAMRPSSTSPRDVQGSSPSAIFESLVMYDRNLARALFEPFRARAAGTEDRQRADMAWAIRTWTLLDPRQAVAAVERMSVDPEHLDQSIGARASVARTLTCSGWRQFHSANSLFEFLPQP